MKDTGTGYLPALSFCSTYFISIYMKKNLDSYTLVAKMRNKRRQRSLKAIDQALYHELVAICNEEGWPDVFKVSNQELCLLLGVTEKIVIQARGKLINSQLLYYRSGKTRHVAGSYSFTQPFKKIKNKTGNIPVKSPVEPPVKSPVESPVNSPVQSPDSYQIETETKNKNLSGESQKRNVSDETAHAHTLEYEKFTQWLHNKASYCSNTRNFPIQISKEQFFQLKEKYTGKQIAKVILKIQNRKDLRERYSDLYITVLDWAEKEYGK
ncbi:MAG: hypothetical protein LUJ25_05105 [Firmicutes bacterium]|nr:hypothetical protein [Bacillota bacterium]